MQSTRPVAIVTGASSGIGRAAAQALSAEGMTVVGTSRSAASAPPLEGVTFLELDVSDDASVRSVLAEVMERFGRVDVLVNNAGVGLAGAAEECSIEEMKALFDVNVFGLIRMTNAALPYMRDQGAGRIVNVSSVLGFLPAPFMAAYAATKHAIEGYSESVDHEVREYGVRVVLVEPAYTSTGFESNTQWARTTNSRYHRQRGVAADVIADAMRDADDPVVVARTIVAAAQASKPRLRYPAGATARRVRMLRRLVPAAAFDKQIRKLNRLPA